MRSTTELITLNGLVPIEILVALLIILLVYVGFYFLFYKRKGNQTTTVDFSTIFQNFVSGLTIIIGGFWVFLSFNLLNQVEQANQKLAIQEQELEIKKHDIAIRNKDLKEKQLSIDNTEASVIDINTEIVDYKVKERNGNEIDETKGLIIEVKIKNTGKSKLTFNLKDDPLTVYNIEAKEHAVKSVKTMKPPVYSSVSSTGRNEENAVKSRPLSTFISLKSSERTLSYFVTVQKGKLYYITFKAQLDDSDDSKNICGKPDCIWFVSKYVFVD